MIDRLLREAADPRAPLSLTAFLELARDLSGEPLTLDRAALAGARADRLGFAFAGGYQAALAALFPATATKVGALSVTEAGGAHPRAIATRLEARALTGAKRWATLASHAEVLYVVASTGRDDDGRNRLVVVRLDPRADGVAITPMPDTPFVPEVPHSMITFDGVHVDAADVLEGDGYERYVKPFRTVEDLHVFAAVAGYLLGEGLRGRWNAALLERLLALLVALRGAAPLPSASSGLHLALAGILAEAVPLFEEVTAAFGEGDAHARWRRDLPLLTIAASAREQRRTAAWRAVARMGQR